MKPRIIVQKFGGSSVGNVDYIKKVAQHIVNTKKKGYSPVVVVSAMGDTTDHLIEMSESISKKPLTREMDMLLATGEQITIALLSMAINELEEKAISLTGPQSGIFTDDFFTKARISRIDTERLLNEINDNKIVIVAGFQGRTTNGEITTLGRGGSDTTAVALCIALEGEKCEIYTDVEGVYTTDPRIVKTARKVEHISYDEMLELAKLGAGVLHPRSVELSRKFNLPLIVRSTFNLDNEGTQIIEVTNMEGAQVRAVTLDEDIIRISIPNVPDQPGIAYKLFSSLVGLNVHVDMILQNLNHDGFNDISFTIQRSDLSSIMSTIENFVDSVGASPALIKDTVAKISIVGTGVTSDVKIASGLFGKIYELGINIEMISTSEIKISCIIDQAKAILALHSIHDYFGLSMDNNH